MICQCLSQSNRIFEPTISDCGKQVKKLITWFLILRILQNGLNTKITLDDNIVV